VAYSREDLLLGTI